MKRASRSLPKTSSRALAESPLPRLSPSDLSRRRVMLLHLESYEVPTHRGVVDWVREHDWALDASAVQNRDLPRLANVAGIITTVIRRPTADWLRQFGCPIVRVHAAPTPELQASCRDFPAVECDFASIGRLGAEHLLTLGRPHFAYYQRSHGDDAHTLRASFVATLRAAGHEPTVLDFLADHPASDRQRPTTLQKRLAWLAGKLRHLPRPLAIMTEDDRFAPDVVEVARALGLRVPTEIAILGCDDNPLSLGVSAIPISSVDSNTWGVGYAAADLLARLVAGEAPPAATIRVPARRVISRQSTATYAGAHPGISAVLQYLRQHFGQPLGLEGLARRARLSVRGLQHAFKQELGCTIQEELRRLRIIAATQLLEGTDLKLDAVAAETNLGDAKNLCRVFAKVHGTSPDAWRRNHREALGRAAQ